MEAKDANAGETLNLPICKRFSFVNKGLVINARTAEIKMQESTLLTTINVVTKSPKVNKGSIHLFLNIRLKY